MDDLSNIRFRTIAAALIALALLCMPGAGFAQDGTEVGFIVGAIQRVWWIVLAIVVLGILIFVHELGHFLLAKYFGVGVIEFAIGFGRKIWSKRYGDSYYSLRLIPLGGYVRMVGDDPRLLQPASAEEHAQPVAPEGDRPESATVDPEMAAHVARLSSREELWLLKKGYWAKFWIVFAGPLFNFLFALFVAMGAAWWFGVREPLKDPVIGYADPNDQAGKAGLRGGDRVLTINGAEIPSWEILASTVRNGDGTPLLFRILRDGKEQEITVQPVEFPRELLAVQGLPTDKKMYKIGIEPSVRIERIGLYESIVEGYLRTIRVTELQIMGLVALFTGDVSPKHISGPIGIFSTASDKAARGLEYLVGFMLFLSIALAIMNLLPIPILDGGHLVFFTLEALRGKPLTIRSQERAAQFGMMFLLLLMVVAFSNDIYNLIQRWTAP